MPDNPVLPAESVAEAMQMLGEAWRGDWSDFDGRTLRHQLDELAAHLLSDEPFDLEKWAYLSGICPVRRSWIEWCPEKIGRESCRHTEAIAERLGWRQTDGRVESEEGLADA